jgi:adenylate cyclase
MGNDSHPPRSTPAGIERRLAAILHADAYSYSRLINEDEIGTLQVLTPYLELMRDVVQSHGGRPVGSRGDSLLAEFPSVVAAVQCAVEMQRELKVRNATLPENKRVEFRMGISLGEIVIHGEQPHGDGINIAVRIEGLAAPGGICIADMVYQQVKNKLPFQYEDLGEQQLKNIPEPVRVWRMVLEDSESLQFPVLSPQSKKTQRKPRKVGTSVFVSVLVVLLGGLATWVLFPSAFHIPHSALRRRSLRPCLCLTNPPSSSCPSTT